MPDVVEFALFLELALFLLLDFFLPPTDFIVLGLEIEEFEKQFPNITKGRVLMPFNPIWFDFDPEIWLFGLIIIEPIYRDWV